MDFVNVRNPDIYCTLRQTKYFYHLVKPINLKEKIANVCQKNFFKLVTGYIAQKKY